MLSQLEIGLKYTRPALAELWGYNGHHGFSKGVFTPKGANLIFLFVTRIKQEALPQYKDCISGGMLFWQGEQKGGTDERIANAASNGEKIYLFYREIHHTPFEFMGEVLLLQPPRRNSGAPSDFVFNLVHDQSINDDLERCKTQVDSLPETEREAVVRARLGQGRFRKDLMEFWGRRCAVTGVDHPALLMASHIKPWRASTNEQRVDPSNGLLLLTQYDRLFDRGLITFDQTGRIRISSAFPKDLCSVSGVSSDARLRELTADHRDYLDFHHAQVFVSESEE